MFNDVVLLECFYEYTWISETVYRNPGQLFIDQELKEAFIAVDLKQIRNTSISAKVPPPGYHAPTQIPSMANTGSEEFICTDICENGTICGQMFSTLGALQMHRTHMTNKGGEHGRVNIVKMVLSNQCIWCHSAFASVNAAKQHVRHSVMYDQCTVDESFIYRRLPYKQTSVCPLCDINNVYPTLEECYEHIAIRHALKPTYMMFHYTQRSHSSAKRLATAAPQPASVPIHTPLHNHGRAAGRAQAEGRKRVSGGGGGKRRKETFAGVNAGEGRRNRRCNGRRRGAQRARGSAQNRGERRRFAGLGQGCGCGGSAPHIYACCVRTQHALRGVLASKITFWNFLFIGWSHRERE